jgi:SAM-dependent methyltransferase
VIRLNLGCGRSPKAGWVNLDCEAWPGVDVVRDVLRGLPFGDGSVDEIYSENFLEHIPQAEVIFLMNEMHRVLVPNGVANHIVPEAGTVYDLSDPTHLSRWHRETLTYFEWSHGHNSYYGDRIKPWVINIRLTKPNELLHLEMVPYRVPSRHF